jgi:hypothetical protein
MNKKEQQKYMKHYRVLHREELNKYNRLYKVQHKVELKIYDKQYKDNNKIILTEYSKIYLKEYRKSHKQEMKEYQKQYRLKHKKESNNWYKNYLKDPIRKLISNYRSRIHIALKNNYKISHTLELLGCSLDVLKNHLEKQFKVGMSWKNYGKWHVDHILPCASFDLTDPKQQKRCFHYLNLQPLWAKENLIKSDKIEIRKEE